MTKQEANDLVKKAKSYINQKVTIKEVEYKFTNISPISCVSENMKEMCKVNGMLLDAKNETLIYPLSLIIKAFG